jgi:hypothetical protein
VPFEHVLTGRFRNRSIGARKWSPTCGDPRHGRYKNYLAQEIFIEQHPGEGDYAGKLPNQATPVFTKPTQHEAIDEAKKRGYTPIVERVRNTDVGERDKWRSP